MTIPGYTLHRLTDDIFAFVHTEGPWGVNNAGLIVGGEDAAMLVDTLFTVDLTRRMLDEMRGATDAAAHIVSVVNTHANGDHCWGNALLKNAEVISTEASAAEMRKVTPEIMTKLLKVARFGRALGPLGALLGRLLAALRAEPVSSILVAAPFLIDIFGGFDFAGIETVFPNRTFHGEQTVRVGKKEAVLVEAGPAHTAGDFFVYIPEDKVLFAGDLLFVGGHPLLWDGPVDNWIDALNRMMSLDAAFIVPGHGALSSKDELLHQRQYFERLAEQSRQFFDTGVPLMEAALRFDLGPFASLSEPERLIVNIDTMYRAFRKESPRHSTVPCFPLMAEYLRRRSR